MRYTIIRDLVPIFEKKMEKYAKKFEKYGTYNYLKSNSYICEDKDDYRYGYWLTDIDVEASYKIGGYSFVASLEWIDDAEENLIKKAASDIYVPDVYKNRRECDHCKTNRKRKSTVILRNIETEEYIQVGKSCVKDYIGYDLGNYASYLSFFSDLEEYLLSCEKDNITKIKPHYQINEILEQTFIEVAKHGYISKAKAIECDCDSTAYKICSMFFGVRDLSTGDLAYSKHVVSDLDIAILDQIAELKNFYETRDDSENDYIGNIKTLLKTDWVEGNNISLIVSAVGTKLRIESEQKALAVRSLSQYVGSVGEKIRFKGKAQCIYSAESSYGYYYIYKIVVENNELVWKTTKNIETDIELNFQATIKAHTEYRGIKQTEITRAKVLS